MQYAIYKNLGTFNGGKRYVGARLMSATFPTVSAARSFWSDADMGNGNHILILPASTPEFSLV